MNRYANAKIYTLVNNVDDEIYIGSTCMPLSKRMWGHKSASKMKPDRHVYEHLNKIGWDNIQIIQVEAYSCNKKEELLARERFWVDILKPTLNQQIPGRTKQEYRVDNEDMELQYRKEYYNKNRETVLKRGAAYKQAHKEELTARQKEVIVCDCCVATTKHHIIRHQRSQIHLDIMEQKAFDESFPEEKINDLFAYIF